MPVVLVREVVVRVGHRVVSMAVGVTQRYRFIGCMVVMVQVVFMLVIVLQRFVRMRMGMALAEMQPHAQRHQRAGSEESRRHRVPQQQNRQRSAEERCHGEVGPGTCRPEVP